MTLVYINATGHSMSIPQEVAVQHKLISFEAFNTKLQLEHITDFSEINPDLSMIFYDYTTGIQYAKQGLFDLALKHFKNALNTVSPVSDWSIKLNCAIGNVYLKQDNTYLASKNFFQAFKKSKKPSNLAYIYYSFGNLYKLHNEQKKAVEYYEKAQKFNIRVLKDSILSGAISLQLAKFCIDNMQTTEGLALLEKAVVVFKEHNCLKELLHCYILQSECWALKKEFLNALLELNLALELSHTHGFNFTESEILLKMALVKLQMGDKQNGKILLEESIYSAEAVQNTNVSDMALQLMESMAKVT